MPDIEKKPQHQQPKTSMPPTPKPGSAEADKLNEWQNSRVFTGTSDEHGHPRNELCAVCKRPMVLAHPEMAAMSYEGEKVKVCIWDPSHTDEKYSGHKFYDHQQKK